MWLWFEDMKRSFAFSEQNINMEFKEVCFRVCVPDVSGSVFYLAEGHYEYSRVPLGFLKGFLDLLSDQQPLQKKKKETVFHFIGITLRVFKMRNQIAYLCTVKLQG
jgi:hypothetical protein